MNSEMAKDDWNQFVAKAKQKWGKLTNDDFTQAQGKMGELVAKLQEVYHMTKEEAAQQLDELGGEHGLGQKFSELSSAAKSAFSDAAKAAQEEVKHAAHSLKEQSGEITDNISHYMERCMQEKPMTTLLVAVGVGALLGAMLKR